MKEAKLSTILRPAEEEAGLSESMIHISIGYDLAHLFGHESNANLTCKQNDIDVYSMPCFSFLIIRLLTIKKQNHGNRS